MSIDATRATWKLGSEVNAVQKLLLLSLADRAGEDGECWPSIARLAKDTNLNEKTIFENRKKLIAKGLIEYTGEFKGKQLQIPVMRLTYIQDRHGLTSTELNSDKTFTTTVYGYGKSLTIPVSGDCAVPISGDGQNFTVPICGDVNLSVDNNNTTTTTRREIPKTQPQVTVDEVINVFHETLPDSPKIRKADESLKRQLKAMIKDWHTYHPEGKKFTLESFSRFLTSIQAMQPRFLTKYETKEGNSRQNGLRTITRPINLAKLVNGEFNFQ